MKIVVPELPYTPKRKKRTKKKKESHRCSWVQTWTSGGTKYTLTCSDCGRTRNVAYSSSEVTSIKQGDTLQPVGKEKDDFAKKYGFLPGEDPADVKRFIFKNRHR